MHYNNSSFIQTLPYISTGVMHSTGFNLMGVTLTLKSRKYKRLNKRIWSISTNHVDFGVTVDAENKVVSAYSTSHENRSIKYVAGAKEIDSVLREINRLLTGYKEVLRY